MKTTLRDGVTAVSLPWWGRLREFLRRCRPWAIGVFVLAGLLTPLFPAEFRYIPLTALLGVIAQALLEVLTHVAAPSQRPHVRVVSDVIEALPEMERCLQECHDYNVPIRIRWIGMTMYNAWNSLQKLLDRLADNRVKDINVEIAMLTGEWLEENPINPEWDRAQADGMAAKIQRYFSAPRLAQLNWKHDIHRYSHMPILHGGLISDRYLFLAISRWDDGCLKAGQKSYEVHRRDDGEYARDRIDVYNDWFSFCSGAQNKWYEQNLSARKIKQEY